MNEAQHRAITERLDQVIALLEKLTGPDTAQSAPVEPEPKTRPSKAKPKGR